MQAPETDHNNAEMFLIAPEMFFLTKLERTPLPNSAQCLDLLLGGDRPPCAKSDATPTL
jgi:hypothetical protein